MTVCVATISQGGIFGASDRMLTASDVEFEPDTPKIYAMSNSIAIMTARDASIHSEVMRDVFNAIGKHVKEQPENWVRVKDVADMCVLYRNAAKVKRAESEFLAPLGLTMEAFIEKQKIMSEGLVNHLARELINYELPHISALVTGIDTDGGPHIYLVQDENIACHDSIGFASIGIGARHALSQLMMSRHTPKSEPVEALLATFIAKKRAEISPGVGIGTDMFVIPGIGQYNAVPEGQLANHLEKIYKKLRAGEIKILKNTRKELDQLVAKSKKGTAAKPTETQKVSPTDGSETSVKAEPGPDSSR